MLRWRFPRWRVCPLIRFYFAFLRQFQTKFTVSSSISFVTNKIQCVSRFGFFSLLLIAWNTENVNFVSVDGQHEASSSFVHSGVSGMRWILVNKLNYPRFKFWRRRRRWQNKTKQSTRRQLIKVKMCAWERERDSLCVDAGNQLTPVRVSQFVVNWSAKIKVKLKRPQQSFSTARNSYPDFHFGKKNNFSFFKRTNERASERTKPPEVPN